MRWALVLILCGCNQLFSIDQTQLPPPDAPPRCPATTDKPLALSTAVTQIILQGCTHYTISATANRAIALCPRLGASTLMLGEGEIDKPLASVAVEAHGGSQSNPRLTPEGDELLLGQFGTPITVGVYKRGPNGWAWASDLGYTLVGSERDGVPSRKPRRVMIYTPAVVINDPATVREVADDGNATWTNVRTYTVADLGVGRITGPPQLSPDGLRMVFTGTHSDDTPAVFYTDRDQVGASFKPAVDLAGAPAITDPFLTEDCARLYFSGLQSIFYSQQL